MDHRAIMDYYNHRPVTRDEFQEFLKNPQIPHEDTRPFHRLLQRIPEDQREALLKTDDSVCHIDIDGNPEGTGFHLGGGWIMTNQHVICCKDEEKSNASNATFIFPHADEVIPPAPRNVIFSYFQDPVGTTAVHDSKKDLALVLVEEILHGEIESVPALIDIHQEPAKEGDDVFLIHYGDGVEDKRNPPQQFSVSDNKMCFTHTNEHGNKLSVHTAHSRPGSSGAPLLVFNEKLQKFLVAAVHYAGPESVEIIDSPGFALWHDWLHSVVRVATTIDIICQNSHPGFQAITNDRMKSNYLDMCYDLQQYLDRHSLRITMRVRLPEGIDFNCTSINFAQ